jgi:hypothetical protein
MVDKNETLVFTSDSLEWKYSYVKNAEARADMMERKDRMLLPNIAPFKLCQVYVKFSGQ